MYELVRNILTLQPDDLISLQHELLQLSSILCCSIKCYDVTLDAAPLIASTIALLLTHIYSRDIKTTFKDIVVSFCQDNACVRNLNLFSDSYLTASSKSKEWPHIVEIFEHSHKPYSLLALIYGLLKVLPSWLQVSSTNISDLTMLGLYPIIISYCDDVTTPFCHQAFYVLDLWTEVVKNVICELETPCLKGNVIDFGGFNNLFSLQQTRPGKIFKFLAMHWEIPVKGECYT